MAEGTILIVDDNKNFCDELVDLLRHRISDATVHGVLNAEKAASLLRQTVVNVVVADMRMEVNSSGYDLLLLIKKKDPRTQVIVITAYPTVEEAVRCMRVGCYDYLGKESVAGGNLVETIQRALELSRFTVDRDSLTERLILSDWDDLQHASDSMRKGIALESLCTQLFQTVPGWQRIESRVKSSTEEIDAVILNESEESFWRKFGSVILVECKNWTKAKKPGRADFDTFYSKIERRGQRDCRLGFFISTNGVAKTFAHELDRISKEEVVIVSMNSGEIWQLICADNRSQALKELVTQRILK